MKIIQNDLCEKCEKETEDLYHLLFNCQTVRNLWKDIESFLRTYTKETLHLDLKTIFLGYEGSKNHQLINYIILLTKSYIYKEKQRKRALVMQGVLNFYKMKFEVGLIIATKNGKVKEYRSMWKPLEQAFNCNM